MAFFSPYLFTGTISLYLGYRTYKSYYSPDFEYLIDNDIQEDSDNCNENKEKQLEDLNKAKWYLSRLIEVVEKS